MNWFCENFSAHFFSVLVVKVNNAFQKVIKYQSTCPNVHFSWTNILKMFRGKIWKGSSLSQYYFNRWIHLNSLAKINNFDNLSLRIKKHVFRFDIMMNNVQTMKILQTIKNLINNSGNFLLLIGIKSNQWMKVWSLDIVHNECVLIIPFVDLM